MTVSGRQLSILAGVAGVLLVATVLLYGIERKPTADDLKTPLSLRVARNEWEGGVVLVYTAAAQTGLRLRAGELARDGEPLKGRVRVKHVTWGKVAPPPLSMARPFYWWPQSESGIETHADRVSLFWLDVFADRDAAHLQSM